MLPSGLSLGSGGEIVETLVMNAKNGDGPRRFDLNLGLCMIVSTSALILRFMQERGQLDCPMKENFVLV